MVLSSDERRYRFWRGFITLRAACVGVCVVCGLFGSLVHTASAQSSFATADDSRAMLDRYCVSCHNDRLQSGGLALDIVDVARPAANPEIWERVVGKLRSGAMPPGGRPRPSGETYDAVASALEAALDQAATASPNPGRTNAVHRLNRTEYRNAIRDLLALDIDAGALLPGDETSDTGFDNNAAVPSAFATEKGSRIGST